MAIGDFPGVDGQGFQAPTAHALPYFASTAARDTWVTAQGGIANIPNGFACYCVATHVITVVEAGAWKSTVALT